MNDDETDLRAHLGRLRTRIAPAGDDGTPVFGEVVDRIEQAGTRARDEARELDLWAAGIAAARRALDASRTADRSDPAAHPPAGPARDPRARNGETSLTSCSACGSEVDPSHDFCGDCGARRCGQCRHVVPRKAFCTRCGDPLEGGKEPPA